MFRTISLLHRFAVSLVVVVCVAIVVPGSVAGARAPVVVDSARTAGAPVGQFTSPCLLATVSATDPLAGTGHQHGHHDHDIFGSRTIGAADSTCDRAQDRSTIWLPTVSVGGTKVGPSSVRAIYRAGDTSNAPVRPMPAGLVMMAGDATASSAQPLSVVAWACGQHSPSNSYANAPRCRTGTSLQLRFRFPECWDGRNTDSSDHRRHLAYADTARCPASHPVAIPRLTVALGYRTRGGPTTVLSSGSSVTGHAGFVNGWDQSTLSSLVDGCIQSGIDCGEGSTGERVRQPTTTTTARPEPAPTTRSGQFVSSCRYSHRLNDDPIVFPGQSGASHSHDFFGNRSTQANSTARSLRNGEGFCNRAGDAAAYWVPSLLVGGNVVTGNQARAYYRSGGKDRTTIVSFPADLRMIAGDAKARSPQDLRISSWACSVDGDEINLTDAPTCPEGQMLRMRILFPDCWNGRDLDSADHKSHMAYAVKGRCPRTHPVPVPQLTLAVRYRTTAGPTTSLASGGQYSGHADFFNTWRQTDLDALVEGCIRTGRTCGTEGGPTLPPRPEFDAVAEALSHGSEKLTAPAVSASTVAIGFCQLVVRNIARP